MKVFIIDSKLRKHCFDVHDSTSIAHVKLLLASMSLVPAGFASKLVYQKRMLGDDESVGSIGYSPERSISLVCVRSSPASTAADLELRSSLSTESNASAAAKKAPVSPAAPAGCDAADATPAAADVSAVSEARRVIFSMGFDEALVQRALARSGGNEQSAVDMLVSGSGQLHLDDAPTLSSSRDACVPAIFSMGFDDALVRRALASAGGDEERAVDLLLSGQVPSSGQSLSASAHACQPVSVAASVPTPAPVLVSSASAAIPSSAPSSSPPPPAIDFAAEWLDEDGRVCPKAVDYTTQCPKGHALVPFADGGCDAQVRRLVCRLCHAFAECENASQWLICSGTGCCAGYAVCDCCVNAGQQEPAVIAAGEGFSTLVTRTAIQCAWWSCSYLLLQGVSLEYLRWMHVEFGPSFGRLTTSQVEKMFLRPRTSRRRCSVTEELAAHAATAHHVGPATWFISHTWSNPFADTLQAIIQFFEGRADAASAMFWFDIFVDSQHADAEPSKSPQWYMTTFKNSIARIGKLLLVVDVWNNPTALQRAW